MKNKYLILTLSLVFALFGVSVHAQINSADILMNINPLNPSPNQNVTVTLSSYALDLNKANIAWSLNNQEKIVGIGKKVFSFTTEAVGVVVAIEARINTFDGQSVVKRALITPAEVDMLWQAVDSYAPPFYRGKTFVSSEGNFKVVALPNLNTVGGKANANNLSYGWRKDDNAQSEASGWGKNYLLIKNSYLDRDNSAEVTVSDISGGANATGSITLQTSAPKIIFYRYDPALGIRYEKALGDGAVINKNGETIVAEPYFFSAKDINFSELDFTWSINDSAIATPSSKNILSIKPEGGKSGTALIKVAINNARTLFQSLEKEINVSF